MEVLSNIVGEINGIVWGPLLLVIILGTGFFLQVGLKFLPIRKLAFGFALLWKGREKATELACTVLPMPNPAIAPKIAKAGASQNHFLPSPFLM